MKNLNEQFIVFLKKYLSSNPDALLWTMGYITLCHTIDDIVDQDNKFNADDKIFILKSYELACMIYSNHFYIQNLHLLYSIIKTASSSFMYSIETENSKESWKKNIGDVIRSNANDVVLMVIEIVKGMDTRIEAGRELRELSYKTHHNLIGEPI